MDKSKDKGIINFIKTKTVFQSGFAILHSHQQYLRAPVALCTHQHLVLSVLILAILIGMG